MGAVNSRLDGGTTLYLKDQNRFSISKISVVSSRRQQTYVLEPNTFPATALFARRLEGDDAPVPFVQNPDVGYPGFAPPFFLSLNNDEDISIEFTLAIRQQSPPSEGQPAVDATVQGLTFIFAPTSRDLDNLITREFQTDPNLHRHPNVQLVGETGQFGTAGKAVREFTWKWDWKPPKQGEDKGGGWKTMCTFVEYDQRAHRLETLAAFGFWVQNARVRSVVSSPGTLSSPPPLIAEMLAPPRIRLPSSQSYQTVMSDSEAPSDSGRDLPSPVLEPDAVVGIPISQTATNTSIGGSVSGSGGGGDVNLPKPNSDDVSMGDDGPLFRATLKAFEQKTGSMKQRTKKVLRRAEALHIAQATSNEAMAQFMEALMETSRPASTTTSSSSSQPTPDQYFQKIAREVLIYERENSANFQKIVIEPMARLYATDIKQAESKRKEFEDESKDYYAWIGRYLGQRQDSMKEKKRAEQDTKYQNKRRNFELKRFDYSSFMQDLHGGRKDQEVLSNLTRFADSQVKAYLKAARKIEEMKPQLDAFVKEVNEANKEFQIQRTEREEKRRTIEASNQQYNEPDAHTVASAALGSSLPSGEADLGRSNSGGRPTSLHHSTSQKQSVTSPSNGMSHSQSVRLSGVGMPASSGDNRFKGIRDLEDKSSSATAQSAQSAAQRKEGLVWALSKPGSHVDPRGLNKTAWHKFWLVLDQGRLSEYTNWKERLELHMDPIDLRLASVREARDSDRRFCFEVITPTFKRVYQAQSEEDMTTWINAINNALQGAYEGRNQPPAHSAAADQTGLSRDIGSLMSGKSASYIGPSLSLLSGSGGLHGSHHHNSSNNNVNRRTTVGGRPSYVRTDSNSYSEDPAKLLKEIRMRDQGNVWCADCNSDSKTDWVSINLGIVLCIECSGIHRSLGTHISKIRSLTLDTAAFTADIVEIIMQIGNRPSNQVWEARLDQSQKPRGGGSGGGGSVSREQRLRFITAKYVDRLYAEPFAAAATGSSPYATPDDFLLASVKRNEIQDVLKALCARASPNAHDRSRNTHAVFLALAAADPAMPGSGASLGTTTATTAQAHAKSSSSTSSSSPTYPPPPPSRGSAISGSSIGPQSPPAAAGQQQQNNQQRGGPAFPVAELLLQNGGEIPKDLPAFPLSASAKLYIEQRRPRTEIPGAGKTGGGMGGGLGNGNAGAGIGIAMTTNSSTAAAANIGGIASSAPSSSLLSSANNVAAGFSSSTNANTNANNSNNVSGASTAPSLTALPILGSAKSPAARDRERLRKRDSAAGSSRFIGGGIGGGGGTGSGGGGDAS